MARPSLTAAELGLLESARRGVLATVRADGRPRLVPLAFAARLTDEELTLYSALDQKPKSVADPRALGRVRDIAARPHVTVLVDRWSEDWQGLAWLRLDGRATLLEPTEPPAAEHSVAVGLLRQRYFQYAEHDLERLPLIRIVVDGVASWFAAAAASV